MRIDILTLFPDTMRAMLGESILGRAQARGLPSVIAVTDRVGNVLGVFRMNGARATATTTGVSSTAVVSSERNAVTNTANATISSHSKKKLPVVMALM